MDDNIEVTNIQEVKEEPDPIQLQKHNEEKVYSKLDFVFSMICILLGYLFIKLVI